VVVGGHIVAEISGVRRKRPTQRLHLLDDAASVLIGISGFLDCDFAFLEA